MKKPLHWIVLSSVVIGVLWWYLRPDDGETKIEATSARLLAVAEPIPHTDPAVTPVRLPPTASSASSGSPAAKAVKKPEVSLEWERELIASLIVMGDADSLLAAALILHELYAGDPGELATVQKLLERAHALVPGDRTTAATALRVCRSIRSCDASRYDQAVRNIDPRNALGPVAELLRKIESTSPGAVTEALMSLAELRLYLYHADLLPRIARAISAAPTTPRNAPDTADLLRVQSELTLRVVQAIEVPSYLSVGAACQGANRRNRFVCEDIARGLSQAELVELQRLALGIQENISGNRARKDSDIEQAESYLNWLGSRMTRRPPPAEQWIVLLAQHHTEMAASRAWLERNGVTQPPVPRGLARGR